MYEIKFWVNILLLIRVLLLTDITFSKVNNEKISFINGQNPLIHKGEDSSTLIYSPEGSLSYRFIAKNIEFSLEKEISWFTYPKIIIYDSNKSSTWLIKSDRAQLINKYTLFLYKNVEINTLTSNSLELYRVTAQKAKINLITHDIILQNSVMLYGKKFHSKGLEMYGNLYSRNILLTKKVKTFYEISDKER